MREGVGHAPPWTDLVGGLLLGSEDFVATCRTHLRGDSVLREIPRAQRYLGRPSLAALFENIARNDKKARDKAIAAAYLTHGYTMRAIADRIQIHYMTVSRAVKKHEVLS